MKPTDVIIPTCKSPDELHATDGEFLPHLVERTAGCPVHVIATCQPLSAAANRNYGLDRAKSDIRLMIDDDIEQMSHGWVQKMAEVLQSRPDAVMVTAELLDSRGNPGPMMGAPPRAPGQDGISEIATRKCLTACIAIRRWPPEIRFDEGYIGSGFEDDDICAQLRQAFPDGVWLIRHDVIAVHRNEMKNQRAPFAVNRKRFEQKWGVQWGSN